MTHPPLFCECSGKWQICLALSHGEVLSPEYSNNSFWDLHRTFSLLQTAGQVVYDAGGEGGAKNDSYTSLHAKDQGFESEQTLPNGC